MNRKQILILASTLMMAATSVMGHVRTRDQIAESKQSEPQSWKRYTVEGREFSVTLPTAPVLSANEKILERPKRERLELKLEVSADALVYSVYIYENPQSRQSLEDFIVKQTAAKGWDKTSERSLTVSGVAGKEYTSQNKHVIAQFLATERRLYRFVASGATAEDPRVKQFFSSIALGEKAEDNAVSANPGFIYYTEDLQDVYKGKEVESKVRLIAKPEPTYTREALQKKVRGTVILLAVFSSAGRVVNIKVVSGLPHGLTEAAIQAAREIKFIPATKDGKPASSWMQLLYNFNF
jgi:TonB family protein